MRFVDIDTQIQLCNDWLVWAILNCKHYDEQYNQKIEETKKLIEVLKAMPTAKNAVADGKEVTRCENCKWFYYPDHNSGKCWMHNRRVLKCDFCSWAQPKEQKLQEGV